MTWQRESWLHGIRLVKTPGRGHHPKAKEVPTFHRGQIKGSERCMKLLRTAMRPQSSTNLLTSKETIPALRARSPLKVQCSLRTREFCLSTRMVEALNSMRDIALLSSEMTLVPVEVRTHAETEAVMKVR